MAEQDPSDVIVALSELLAAKAVVFDGGLVGFWGVWGVGWGWICVGGVGRVLFSESPGAKRKAG
ncbi:hypothetical protein, partial [Paenarthrobacter nitroguajacolicus]|uniref:hypothetical protein n=1 Tax=Paenarthrobacter nitroguajacolicus TaxID=211146 RepID=UPI0040544665